MLISGTHGTLSVDASTGAVIEYEPEGSAEYADIAWFDLAEWRAYYGQAQCEGGDILDFGYWLLEGKYEPPEMDWRATWRAMVGSG